MLKLKIRPGNVIAIGEGITLTVVLDSDRKMALELRAPGLPIKRLTPADADLPQPEAP